MKGSRATETALGLGTASFAPGYGLGDGPATSGDDERLLLINEALASGIRYIDTSHHYGAAETLVGRVGPLVRARGVRVCAKFTAADSPDVVRRTLHRLDAGAVDTIMLHTASVGQLTDPRVAAFMDELKSANVTARTGASTYGVDDAVLALTLPWMDAIQIEHSILHPAVAAAVVREKRPNQELVVRSVLCKGLLTPRRAHLTGVSGAIMETVARLETLAVTWGFASLPELAIRFALDTPGVDVVLVGVTTHDELRTAIAATERRPLSAAQLGVLAGFDRSADPWVHPERWEVAG